MGPAAAVSKAQTFDRKPHGASDSQAWLRSPFYQLVEREERMLRRRIDETSIAEFPVLADFAAMGGTDYLALRQPIGSGAAIGEVREMFASWVTDRPSGFRTEEVSLFERLQPYLVLAVRSVSNVWIARALLETYLGRDAARRVLAGDIVRGRTETTRKVIWYSDLRDFTRLTDRLPQAEMLRIAQRLRRAFGRCHHARGRRSAQVHRRWYSRDLRQSRT